MSAYVKYVKITGTVSNTKGGITMKRIFLVILIALLCVPFAECAERFVTFPALGRCTGTYVRYRDIPGTDGEIVGRLNSPERVIVIGQTVTDGDLWYEIEDPRAEATAFVFGKYIAPVFDETTQQSELYRMLVSIFQSYGITKEKAMFNNGPSIEIEHTDDAGIFQLDVWEKGCSFGDVNIGDDRKKLREILGEPDVMSESEWEYRLDTDIIFTFRFTDSRISHMSYQWPQS